MNFKAVCFCVKKYSFSRKIFIDFLRKILYNYIIAVGCAYVFFDIVKRLFYVFF